MARIGVIYSPFASPASPPYSAVNLYSYLKANTGYDVEIIDLNLLFHKMAFPEHFDYFRDISRWDSYDSVWKEYRRISEGIYSDCNKRIVKGDKPLLYDELLKIVRGRYDIVLFSLVYSSQAFYSYALMGDMDDGSVKIFAGGPAVNEKIKERAMVLQSPSELLRLIGHGEKENRIQGEGYLIDYKGLDIYGYMSPYPVIPAKSSSSCYYKGCAFCSHHLGRGYEEYPLERVRDSIVRFKERNIFFIDDMISPKRLDSLSLILEPLNINWACQLKPDKAHSEGLMQRLRKSGLSMIIWGIESGNDRILKLMGKGTDKALNSHVLKISHEAGIRNVVYMIFGFPTETKEEFLESIDFLKRNSENIDLVSTSIFGLQKGTKMFEHPEKFGIYDIEEKRRTILGPKISYGVRSGLLHDEVKKLRSSHIRMIEMIGRYPRGMNLFREHMLIYDPPDRQLNHRFKSKE